jgi:hypothetical protein
MLGSCNKIFLVVWDVFVVMLDADGFKKTAMMSGFPGGWPKKPMEEQTSSPRGSGILNFL